MLLVLLSYIFIPILFIVLALPDLHLYIIIGVYLLDSRNHDHWRNYLFDGLCSCGCAMLINNSGKYIHIVFCMFKVVRIIGCSMFEEDVIYSRRRISEGLFIHVDVFEFPRIIGLIELEFGFWHFWSFEAPGWLATLSWGLYFLLCWWGWIPNLNTIEVYPLNPPECNCIGDNKN